MQSGWQQKFIPVTKRLAWYLSAPLAGYSAFLLTQPSPERSKVMAAATSTPYKASTSKDIPGEPKHLSSSVLEAGATAFTSLGPIRSIGEHLCAFHVYDFDTSRQVEAHHYCSHINEDFRQCAIYDTDRKDARLIGVEFVITEKLFNTLDDEEKRLWHSHDYEVRSGMLIMPGVPEMAEKRAMKELVNTYGKTFHWWQYDRGDALPLGVPQLMNTFTADGQLNPRLQTAVEARYGVSLEGKRKSRSDLEPQPHISPLVNHCWRTGKGFVLEPKEVDLPKHDKKVFH
eukprot:jgi/Mesen1/8649/ME000502S08011